jgi:hypothetical protein
MRKEIFISNPGNYKGDSTFEKGKQIRSELLYSRQVFTGLDILPGF